MLANGFILPPVPRTFSSSKWERSTRCVFLVRLTKYYKTNLKIKIMTTVYQCEWSFWNNVMCDYGFRLVKIDKCKIYDLAFDSNSQFNSKHRPKRH